jgi:hypothetical protein
MQQQLKTSNAYFKQTSAEAVAADFRHILLQPSTTASTADFECILQIQTSDEASLRHTAATFNRSFPCILQMRHR